MAEKRINHFLGVNEEMWLNTVTDDDLNKAFEEDDLPVIKKTLDSIKWRREHPRKPKEGPSQAEEYDLFEKLITSRHLDLTNLFIDYYDVNERSLSSGKLAIQIAFADIDWQRSLLLLKNGARPVMANENGPSSMWLATRHYNDIPSSLRLQKEVVAFLAKIVDLNVAIDDVEVGLSEILTADLERKNARKKAATAVVDNADLELQNAIEDYNKNEQSIGDLYDDNIRLLEEARELAQEQARSTDKEERNRLSDESRAKRNEASDAIKERDLLIKARPSKQDRITRAREDFRRAQEFVANLDVNEHVEGTIVRDWNAKDKFGFTYLIRNSFTNAFPTAVRLLQEEGCDLSLGDSMGHTPLMFAIIFNAYTKAISLIDASSHVDVNVADNLGNTPLSLACDLEKTDRILAAYEEQPVEDNVSTRSDLVRRLLSKAADVKRLNSEGQTVFFKCFDEDVLLALLYGISSSQVRVVRDQELAKTPLKLTMTLIPKRGYQDILNVVDKYGKTALMYAVEANLPRIVFILLLSSAKDDIIDSDGKKAIDYTVSRGMREFLLTRTMPNDPKAFVERSFKSLETSKA